MLSITPKAKDYITEKILEQDKTYAYLSIKGGGCTGFEYEWTFTDDTSVGKVIEDVLVVDKLAEP